MWATILTDHISLKIWWNLLSHRHEHFLHCIFNLRGSLILPLHPQHSQRCVDSHLRTLAFISDIYICMCVGGTRSYTNLYIALSLNNKKNSTEELIIKLFLTVPLTSIQHIIFSKRHLLLKCVCLCNYICK